jgi:hypothetical protein
MESLFLLAFGEEEFFIACAMACSEAFFNKLPSRPGESHPEPLTEPCLTVSRHTARATQ